ncbi:nucleotide-diphospho-sugar transferase [Rhodotorula diobovata]|uniref:Nucleotide-diphospho-sugar transferase n=1 Tax=Rhodotorula diobovata TaxID=5288 RepID=A0A5C5FR73_9BASI|nr:nucleotide-diphospho-sugar transferase [Rhodotorula diobovata]
MAHERHPYPPPLSPGADDSDDGDDELALAEQLLAASPRHGLASPRWAQPAATPRGGAGAGWRKWQGRQSLWHRSSNGLVLAALAILVVLFGGAASTQSHVRDYVKDRVAMYSGQGGPLPQRANATIVILVNPFSNMYQALLPTLENIELKFNRRMGYPIQLLTDGHLPSEAIRNRTDFITNGKATWSVVTHEQGWGPPDWLPQKTIDEGLRTIPFPLGYRNMCRFFSMFHWKHPALEKYDWIFRLDEGITFHCELQEDPFETMIRNNKTYGFTNVDQEAPFVIPTLWKTAQEFFREAPRHYFPAGRDESFVSDDGGKTYNRRMYYNNFEIVHRSVGAPPFPGAVLSHHVLTAPVDALHAHKFLESEPYQAFVNHLDRAGGFYKERWGDAPIRTIAASYFLPASALHSFSNVTGYRHDLPPFECPDLPCVVHL